MSDIPCVLKSRPNMSITSLSLLRPGLNPGVILSCKVTSLVSNKSDIPGSFGVMDMQGIFGVVSLYNASPSLYAKINKYANIQIMHPLLKRIKTNIQEKSVDLVLVQVYEVSHFFLEGASNHQ